MHVYFLERKRDRDTHRKRKTKTEAERPPEKDIKCQGKGALLYFC